MVTAATPLSWMDMEKSRIPAFLLVDEMGPVSTVIRVRHARAVFFMLLASYHDIYESGVL
jgi:hypothetical protein